jgi:glycosyltransferase involved in cell wall biosynthesis
VAYFGFIYPAKGTDAVFDIASPLHHRLVLVGDLRMDDPYHKRILDRIDSDEWRGHALTTGFLPEYDAAAILAVADAVVLPFTEGSGPWNTSVYASAKQGTFVLTTSRTTHGYDAAANVYSAPPGAVDEMRQALREYIGCRVSRLSDERATEWRRIAEAHLQVYRQVLGMTA